MFLVSLLFFIFFAILFLFSLFGQPIYYCIFLVLNSLICSLICYTLFGFSWYSLLFCLVYIGGVYILFVFVSAYRPKVSYVRYFNMDFSFFALLIFRLIVLRGVFLLVVEKIEFSRFLCTVMEGSFYVSMCLTLLFGFSILSIVMSIKLNYYR